MFIIEKSLRSDKKNLLNLHSIFSVVLAFTGFLFMFEAVHSNVFMLSVLFPTNVIEVSCDPSMVLMIVDSRYQVIIGAGNAFLLTSHQTSISLFSLIVSGLSLGIKETLRTSTKK